MSFQTLTAIFNKYHHLFNILQCYLKSIVFSLSLKFKLTTSVNMGPVLFWDAPQTSLGFCLQIQLLAAVYKCLSKTKSDSTGYTWF